MKPWLSHFSWDLVFSLDYCMGSQVVDTTYTTGFATGNIKIKVAFWKTSVWI